jgi:hypothetical protein
MQSSKSVNQIRVKRAHHYDNYDEIELRQRNHKQKKLQQQRRLRDEYFDDINFSSDILFD